jgi:hypothetical protein
MLHLMESVLHANCGPVYSLQLDNSDEDPLSNQELIRIAIEEMKNRAMAVDGVFKGVIGCGHSKGAMQVAHLGFNDPSSHVVAVHSIAGRLKIVEGEEKECYPSLIPMVNAIFAGISAHPNLPLYQYVGTEDWNASQEAMIVRPETATTFEGAMHLNVLFASGIKEALIRHLQEV